MTQAMSHLRDPARGLRRPRLGFLGVGWIGRSRLEAIARCDACDLVAVADPDDGAVAAASKAAPRMEAVADLDALLERDLDGLVIATPSAQHAGQARRAMEAGVAVFCQKPLGRTAPEAEGVVEAAQRADRLLGVDMSYRHVKAFARVVELARDGDLGEIASIDLTFHNAYGPDKEWFHDPHLSGGGCLLDLGVHLIDLAQWALGDDEADRVEPALYRRSERLELPPRVCEDRAYVQMTTRRGVCVRLACSWNLHLGRDAEIAMVVQGASGGAEARNIGGSFFEFEASRFEGTRAERLAGPPDDWFGRAAAVWAERLARDASFDEGVRDSVGGMRVIDLMYGRKAGNGSEER